MQHEHYTVHSDNAPHEIARQVKATILTNILAQINIGRDPHDFTHSQTHIEVFDHDSATRLATMLFDDWQLYNEYRVMLNCSNELLED